MTYELYLFARSFLAILPCQIADLRQQLTRIPVVEEENRKLAKALGESQEAQVACVGLGLASLTSD